ncbi:hypothetical protein NKI01_22125 [Mesorhizobium sp. M0815]|uniref:hypothetical protein n=1 Tax=Mesorhizobium sp. M0815 TaxID=2957005 RepID=UPI003336E79F
MKLSPAADTTPRKRNNAACSIWFQTKLPLCGRNFAAAFTKRRATKIHNGLSITIYAKRNISKKLSLGIDRDRTMQLDGDTKMMKILSAFLLAIGLATSAMAQSMGSGTGSADGNTGVNTGTSGGNIGTGSATTPNTIDPNATNATTPQTNGMEDRCKDTAGSDTDNNTPSGAMTSDMQNCNK